VVGDRIYLLGADKEQEEVIALDTNAKEQWRAPIGPVFDFAGNAWSHGPNAAPVVDGDSLYALGSQGELVCVNTKTGKVTWRKNLPRDMKGEVNPITGPEGTMGWGYSWAPLVDGEKLIITPGGPQGLFAALNKTDGKEIWRTKDLTDQCTYASPMKVEIEGVPQYLAMVQDGIVSVSTGGKLLWRYKRNLPYSDVVCTMPIYHDGHVLISATKGGGEFIKVTKNGGNFAATRAAVSRRLSNLHGGLVLVDRHVYGSYELRAWVCVEFPTGKQAWESEPADPGAGSVSYADGHLYCASQEDNTISLIEANPEGVKVKGRFQLPKQSTLRKTNAKLWTHPVIANGCLFIRDQELLYCYKVK
jgi:outer membrane protein assembly factor BamB